MSVRAPIDGVDVEEGLLRLGDPALYETLLRQFVTSFRDAAERVRAALERGDREAAADVAHAVRGVSGNLAVNEVRAAATLLEQLLRGEATADTAGVVDALESALARAVSGIDRALGTEGDV